MPQGFNPENWALYAYKDDGKSVFVLYDWQKFVSLVRWNVKEEQQVDYEEAMNVVGSFISLEPPDASTGQCDGAWSVGNSARNAKYPGMGRVIYKLASAYMGVPLTSDRHETSSDDALALWQRLDRDPDMQATPEFDHFLGKQRLGTKDSDFAKISEPRTPSTHDDCSLSRNGHDTFEKGLKTKNTGMAAPFVQRHKKAMLMLNKFYSAKALEQLLADAGMAVFYVEYDLNESFKISSVLFPQ